jgi:hypothetical protein
LHHHPIAPLPARYASPHRIDVPGNLTPRGARKFDWDRQATFLEPEIQSIQSTMMNSDHHLLRARHRDRDIHKLELPGLANSDQLERFH